MAILDEATRRQAWRDVMEEESNLRNPIGVTKDVLRAALDATDEWVEANQASFNSALPVAARNGLTARQKAMLLQYVLIQRFRLS